MRAETRGARLRAAARAGDRRRRHGQDVPVYLDEVGRCSARELVTLQPQVSGRVTQIHFGDGADVKAGELLFTIDSRPFQAQLAAAEATLAQTKASLDLAKLELARVTGLLDKKAAAQQELDTAKNVVTVTEARVLQNQAAAGDRPAQPGVQHPALAHRGPRRPPAGRRRQHRQGERDGAPRHPAAGPDLRRLQRDRARPRRGAEEPAKGRSARRSAFPTSRAAATRRRSRSSTTPSGRHGTVLLRATIANAERRSGPGASSRSGSSSTR
jgi:multidrug efflux pump subunit AcrA (membrane-fusion protein)